MGFAKYQPMRQIECISVFCKNSTAYYPEMILRDKPQKAGGLTVSDIHGDKTGLRKALRKTYTHKFPINIIVEMKCRSNGTLHPTQKPVALLEYLIKTYTLENELILDFTCGSGSTGIIDIYPDVGSAVDAGDEQIYRLRAKLHNRKLDTVGR